MTRNHTTNRIGLILALCLTTNTTPVFAWSSHEHAAMCSAFMSEPSLVPAQLYSRTALGLAMEHWCQLPDYASSIQYVEDDQGCMNNFDAAQMGIGEFACSGLTICAVCLWDVYSINNSHFGVFAYRHWHHYHQLALEAARRFAEGRSPSCLNAAMAVEGWALHFLADAFASGHAWNPSGDYLDLAWMRATSPLRLAVHEDVNDGHVNGTRATFAPPFSSPFETARGDGELHMISENNVQLQALYARVRASSHEVYATSFGVDSFTAHSACAPAAPGARGDAFECVPFIDNATKRRAVSHSGHLSNQVAVALASLPPQLLLGLPVAAVSNFFIAEQTDAANPSTCLQAPGSGAECAFATPTGIDPSVVQTPETEAMLEDVFGCAEPAVALPPFDRTDPRYCVAAQILDGVSCSYRGSCDLFRCETEERATANGRDDDCDCSIDEQTCRNNVCDPNETATSCPDDCALGLHNPSIAGTGSTRVFRVTYTHNSAQPPSFVRVALSGAGTFEMTESDPFDTDFTDGKDYSFTRSFPDGNYTYRFEAARNGGPPVSTGTFNFAVNTAAAQIILTASPNPMTQFDTTRLTAIARTSAGQAAPGVLVEFSTIFTGFFSGGNAGVRSAVTDANGVATIDFTPNASGSATVEARVGSVTQAVVIAVHPSTSIDIELAIGTVRSDANSSTYRLSATVADGGAPVSFQSIEFQTTLGTIADPTQTTSMVGHAQTELVTTMSGPALISATISGSTRSINTVLNVGPPPPLVFFRQLPYSVPDVGSGESGGGRLAWLGTSVVLAIPQARSVMLWDLSTDSTVTFASFSNNDIYGIRSNAAGTELAVVQDGGEVSFLSPNGTLLRRFDSGRRDANSVDWLDGGIILGRDQFGPSNPPQDAAVSEWSVTGIYRTTFPSPNLVTGSRGDALAVATHDSSPRRVAAAGANGTLYVWTDSGSVLANPTNLTGNNDPLYDVAFSPDGARLAVVGEGVARVYNTSNWSFVDMSGIPANEDVEAVTFADAGRLVVVGTQTGEVQLYDLSGTLTKEANVGAPVYGLSWNESRGLLAAGTPTGTFLFDLNDNGRGPDITINAPATVSYSMDSLQVTGTISDPSGIQAATLTINGATAQTLTVANSAFAQMVALAVGPNTLRVEATDNIGDSSSVQTMIIRQADSTPPAVIATQIAPLRLERGASVQISANVTDFESGVATVNAHVQAPDENVVADVALLDDGVPPDAVGGDDVYTGRWDSSLTTEGDYLVDIVAVDNAMLQFEAENAAVFTVFDEPRIENVTQTPASPSDSDNVTVRAQITDPAGIADATLVVTVGGRSVSQPMTPNGSLFEGVIPARPAVDVHFQILATDSLGNSGQSALFMYSVEDRTPPEIVSQSTVPVVLTEATTGPFIVRITPIDAGGSGLAPQPVLLSYRRETIDATMTAFAPLTAAGNGLWSGAVPEPAATWRSMSGRTMTFQIRVLDGAGNTFDGPVNAVIVEEVNDPPSQPFVEIQPAPATTADGLQCVIAQTSIDPENEPVLYTYRWFRDGAPEPNYTTTTTSALRVDLPFSATAGGESWRCVVTPWDGSIFGLPASADVSVAPICGDGLREAREDCDDGNTSDGDCCSAACTFEAVGDVCDDGLYCNGTDRCDGSGRCANHSGSPCGAGLTCQLDRCCTGNDTTCDGVDDDCDGTNDEDFVPVQTHCGVGACVRSGNTTCTNGSPGNSCTPGQPAANDATCDGIDDDCDGTNDEDFVPVQTHCGVGACIRTGNTTCLNGSPGNSCTPGQPAANDATCDGIDDDCDGTNDEDYVPLQTHCGVGACVRSGDTTCTNGNAGDSCTPGHPAANDATCDGIDDDCDGTNDEDFVSVNTTCGVGACARSGNMTCTNGNTGDSCTPGQPAANDATCDGIDDDCDGTNDEDYVPLLTHCGVGACVRSGNTTCTNGNPSDSCTPGQPAANDATCDGIDDDCDGTNDEDFVSVVTACGVGACAGNGNMNCINGNASDSCTPGQPAANDATCDGIDDDCDGNNDEDFVPVQTHCGVGACARTGVRSCVGGAAQDSCVEGSPTAETSTCDGVDNDCDGVVDEGCTDAGIHVGDGGLPDAGGREVGPTSDGSGVPAVDAPSRSDVPSRAQDLGMGDAAIGDGSSIADACVCDGRDCSQCVQPPSRDCGCSTVRVEHGAPWSTPGLLAAFGWVIARSRRKRSRD